MARTTERGIPDQEEAINQYLKMMLRQRYQIEYIILNSLDSEDNENNFDNWTVPPICN